MLKSVDFWCILSYSKCMMLQSKWTDSLFSGNRRDFDHRASSEVNQRWWVHIKRLAAGPLLSGNALSRKQPSRLLILPLSSATTTFIYRPHFRNTYQCTLPNYDFHSSLLAFKHNFWDSGLIAGKFHEFIKRICWITESKIKGTDQQMLDYA